MAKRLTDKKKKQIIADYAELGTVAATARKHKVSRETVTRTLRDNPDVAQIVTEKREENTQDVMAYLDSKVDAFKRFSDYVFDERLNPATNREELDKTSLDKIMTVFGVGTDKLLKSRELAAKTKANDGLSKVADNLESMKDTLMNAVPNRELPDE